MTSSALFIGGVILAGLGFAWLVFRQRKQDLLASIRAAWGEIRPIQSLDDSWTAEAWRATEAGEQAATAATAATAAPAATGLTVAAGATGATGAMRGAGATQHSRSHALDERTWTDLDMDRVVATLDRTHSGLGRQRLYQRLRDGVAWSHTPWMETLAVESASNSLLRESLCLILARAGRTLGPGLWTLTVPGAIVVRRWYWCFPLLTTAMIASLGAIAVFPRAILAVALLALVNMTLRAIASWQVPGLLEPLRQVTPLLTTARRLETLPEITSSARVGIAEKVERLRSLERMGQWVSRDPHSSGELVASLWEYLNVLLLLDANALLFAERVLKRDAHTLRVVAEWVGDVDCAIAVACLRSEPRTWARVADGSAGSAASERSTTIRQLWHPLVEQPVANDADLEPAHGLVLTGANMTGKSTYLRAVGIAVVLARTLNTCPAAEYNGHTWRVRSLIGRSDDLSTGTSYYFAEARRIVELLNDAEHQPATVFLLDELLRGTNTIERLAAGEAVLRGLIAPSLAHSVLVATHDGELVARLADCYSAWHFRESTENGRLRFDFQRRSGPSTTRTAIALLAMSGAPESVVARAHELVEAAHRTAHLPDTST